MFGVLCDVFDGWIARGAVDRPEGADQFGAELDSLADIVHSVVAPAVWIIFFSMIITFTIKLEIKQALYEAG